MGRFTALTLVTLTALSFPHPSLAEGEIPVPAYAVPVAHEFDTGELWNLAPQLLPVHSYTVHHEGAPSMRVFFAEVDVPDGGWLVATSMKDGHQHAMDADELRRWSHTSAYFNGDMVQLDLFLPPGSRGSYRIDHVLVGIGGLVTETICGSADDRVPSNDNRSLRMLNGSGTAACSGWLASADNCVLSAGHCFPTYASVAESNVPLSNSNGSFNHPPPQDQFPVDGSSLSFVNGGTGNDWAIAKLNTNSLGQSPVSLFGFFPLATGTINPGATLRIVGYGSDSGTANQTNQTHTGPLFGAGSFYDYQIDTTGGNSGSVVYVEATGEAIAIHTHGGCSSGGGSNLGTNLSANSGFQAAFSSKCTTSNPTLPVADFSANLSSSVTGATIFFSDASGGIPTSWQWDFNEDGITDSTAQNPAFTYNGAGTFDVRLTVTNAFGSDTKVATDFLTILSPTPVTLPYGQSFNSGLPADGSWKFQSSGSAGSITAGSNGAVSPGSGGNALLMATQIDGITTQNDATLYFRLPAGDVTLTYWFKEFSDESDPQDGVFLSNGITEVLLVSHQGLSGNWAMMTADIDAAAAGAGYSVNDVLQIRFRQLDNFTIPSDGHAIDDVTLSGGATFTINPTTLSASSGGTITFSANAGPTSASDFYAIVGSFSGSAPGFNAGGFHIPLNPDPWFFFTLSQPNTAPFSGLQGVLNASGQGTGQFSLPAGVGISLVGLTIHHLFATADASGTVLSVSNSASFSVVP